MQGILQLKSNELYLDPSCNVIKKDELFSLISINELKQATQKEVEQILQKSKEDYQNQYEAGFEQGKLEGIEQYSEKIMTVAMESLDALSQIEENIVDVVVSSVAKILGSFEKNDLTVKIIKNTLGQLRGEKHITVRVCQAEVDEVRNAFQAYLISSDGRTGYLEIVADPSLKDNACVIETSLGLIDSSLSTQMQILNKIFKQQFVSNLD